jgi:N-acetyl-anhydromuramyl-L-alanine amidase AmpD
MKLKRVLMLKMSGEDVRYLQIKLKEFGFFTDRIDGYFGQNLLISVTNFQREIGIRIDGVVGPQTWSQLDIWGKPKPEIPIKESNKKVDIPNKISHIGNDGLIIYDNFLSDEEIVKEEVTKNTIWLHHTAGGSRPDWTIGGWEKDFQKDKNGNPVLDKDGNPKPLKVATHFVIGRKSSSSNDNLWDGKVLKAFDDRYWAYHLGITTNSKELNSKSISIEICNYGPLRFGKDGIFYNYVNKPVNKEDVVELEKPFRGYKYWEKYTDAQIESLKKLIIYLKNRWNLEIETGIYNEDWFEYNDKWFTTGGLRTHTQVRKDKSDLFPQPELIQMLNSL